VLKLLLYGIPLGRWRGIPLHLHLTFFLLVLYLVLTTQALWLDLSLIGVWVASTLLHELGHCEAARKVGGKAERVIMWPLGGLALTAHPDTPKAEALVAGAGPAVNLFLALAAGAILLVRPDVPELGDLRLGGSSLVTSACLLVALVNAFLFVLNVVPAYPLDGGRLFRALLRWPLGWKRATLAAGLVALVLGGLLAWAAIAYKIFLMLPIGVIVMFSSGRQALAAYRFQPRPEYGDLMPHERR
jgi:Zn-dependent protease